MLFKKGTKLYSIFNNKCPKCHEGDFFIDNNFFHFRQLLKLHKNCSHCNLKYLIEPSFFYGAMYVNYGLTVALSVATYVIANTFFNLSPLESFITIVVALALFSIHTMRLSRIIWINIFVKYKKK